MKRIKSRVVRSNWYRSLLRYSQRITLPGFQGLPLYDVIVFFLQQLKDIGLSDRAAAISFNIIMALPAGLIFVATLIPYLPKAEVFQQEIIITLDAIISDDGAYKLISSIVNDFFEPGRTNILSISFLLALFFSSNAMIGIMDTFDKSYYEVRKKHLLAKRWMALKLTLLLILLLFASGLILVTQGSIRHFLLEQLGWDIPKYDLIVNLTRWLLIFLIIYFTIAFIYRFAPATSTRWKLLSPGAVLATLLTILTTWLFSLWVDNFSNYNKVYGSIGTVLILLNLVYINALILIIGFEINVSIRSIKQAAEKRRLMQESSDAALAS